jgi:hypothetical protein
MLRQIMLGVAFVAAGALAFQTWRVNNLLRENAALESTVEGYKEAARIYAQYAESRRLQLEDAAATERDLMEMEGRNEPLSDHLRNAAGRVWSTP